MLICREAAPLRGLTLAGSRIVVQGFGNVGSIAARMCHEAGAKIIGVSDIAGGIVNPAGIDMPKLIAHYEKARSFEGFGGVQEDLQHGSARARLRHPDPRGQREPDPRARTPRRSRAKIIVEGANGPTTQRADDVLRQKNVLVVPDILANAGGVTVSYFEWVQDRAGFFWREQEVNERLEDIMVQSFKDVATMAEKLRRDATGSPPTCSASARRPRHDGARAVRLTRAGRESLRKAGR